MRYDHLTWAQKLETDLGDPHNPAIEFSYSRCAALDDTEQFPAEICAELDRWGMHHHYVPEEWGGALCNFVTPAWLIRTVARRDLTVAVAHGKTFLGSVPAWVSPPSPGTRRLAAQILEGCPVSLALTEPGRGSDLLAGQVRAVSEPEGFCLTGEKWLINNATRGRLLTVLARTCEDGGPRGFDLFVVDKQLLQEQAYSYLPKVRTLGIRGADISGIAFHAARVPGDARLGPPGGGLETMLKALQLTRTLCAALSLGAGEHALSLAVDFATARTLYGRPLIDLPAAQATLIDAFADHLLTEAVTLVAARSIHTLPDDLSITSAAVKYLVPTRTDRMIGELGRLLGARAVFVDGHADGRFQKLARDHRIVGIFDGNTLVNLNSIVNEFPTIARRAERVPPADALADTFDPDHPLRRFEPGRLRLTSRPGGAVLQALPGLAERLTAMAGSEPSLQPLVDQVYALRSQTAALLDGLAECRPARLSVPRHHFTVAQRYALCHAAVAAVGLWVHHRRSANGPAASLWRDGRWLRLVLGRVLTDFGIAAVRSAELDAVALEVLLEQRRAGWSHSLFPLRLAEGPSAVTL